MPVIRDGELVGIVSRANLLHGLVAQRAGVASSGSDDEIRSAIMGVLIQIGIPRHFLNVVVSGGVVYLWGATESEAEHKAVRVAAETTPGVKRTENLSSFFPQGCAARWEANSQEWIGMILLGIGLAQRAGRPEDEAINS